MFAHSAYAICACAAERRLNGQFRHLQLPYVFLEVGVVTSLVVGIALYQPLPPLAASSQASGALPSNRSKGCQLQLRSTSDEGVGGAAWDPELTRLKRQYPTGGRAGSLRLYPDLVALGVALAEEPR